MHALLSAATSTNLPLSCSSMHYLSVRNGRVLGEHKSQKRSCFAICKIPENSLSQSWSKSKSTVFCTGSLNMQYIVFCLTHWHQFPPKLGRIHDIPFPPLPPLPFLPLPSLTTSLSHPFLTEVQGINSGKMFDFTDTRRWVLVHFGHKSNTLIHLVWSGERVHRCLEWPDHASKVVG